MGRFRINNAKESFSMNIAYIIICTWAGLGLIGCSFYMMYIHKHGIDAWVSTFGSEKLKDITLTSPVRDSFITPYTRKMTPSLQIAFIVAAMLNGPFVLYKYILRRPN
jgi:hypothetical protein